MDIVNELWIIYPKNGLYRKRMSNAPSHVLAQAAVVAAYKLLDH